MSKTHVGRGGGDVKERSAEVEEVGRWKQAGGWIKEVQQNKGERLNGVCQVWRQRCRSQALASSSRRTCEDSAEVWCCVTNMGFWSRRRGAELRWWLSASLPRWMPTQLIKAYNVCLMLSCVSFYGATVYLRFIFGRAACRRSRTTDVSSVTENDIRLVFRHAVRLCYQNPPLMYPTEHKSIISDVCRRCTFSRKFMKFCGNGRFSSPPSVIHNNI